MSWEDQGRQEHGWFGHGTAPPKDSVGEGAERSEAEARDPDADAQADAAAAARAYAWAKRFGPVLYGFAHGGPALEAFADTVARLERAGPGSLAQALNEGSAAQDEGAAAGGSVMLVSDTAREGRYPAPFADALPGLPEAQALAHTIGKGVRALEDAIGRVFHSDSQGGGEKPGAATRVGTSGAPANGAAAAASGTPPEDPEDGKQRRFLTNVDRQLDEVQETTDNASYDQLKDTDLDAARRELDGEVVARRADASPYDHVTKVIQGQRSLNDGISQIKSLMTRVPMNTPQYARLERMLGELSNRLDYSRNFAPKGTVSSSAPGLVSP